MLAQESAEPVPIEPVTMPQLSRLELIGAEEEDQEEVDQVGWGVRAEVYKRAENRSECMEEKFMEMRFLLPTVWGQRLL